MALYNSTGSSDYSYFRNTAMRGKAVNIHPRIWRGGIRL